MFKTPFHTCLMASSALLAFVVASQSAHAQNTAPPAVAEPAAAQQLQEVIATITVVGTQRLEPSTVLSYIRLRQGNAWSQASADQALKDLFATELFADVSIRNNNGAVVVEVRENPVVNRIILEGNKRLKEDKINPEIKLGARQIYSRSKVRADVARIVELYKRQGRFAATVEPKLVQLDQNRVDIVFEITEGPKSKVRQINIIGNDKFSDGDLRGQMVTKQARITSILSSGTSYDPDRMAFDQQKLRQFYLTQGYADFRVVSAVAELTPDKQDFIITYVVEEGERYKFGEVKVDSAIRDFKSESLTARLPMKKDDWYDAKSVEDTVELLQEGAGLLGYAFAEVNPDFLPDRTNKVMAITFNVAESPRVFVERININGNNYTQDKVIRREFRLNEGDAFNSFQVKRTADRIKSLGYFQEDLEIEQEQGSAPDRIVLTTNIEEKPSGELSLSAGFSSLESFIFQGSIAQNNFRGKGQQVRTSVAYSRYTKSAEIGFSEPYLFDRSISLSADIFRRDQNSFNFINNERNTTYENVSTGFQLRSGVPINEFMYFQARYGLSFEDVSLDRSFFTDPDGATGPLPATCDPLSAGRYLCDAIGKRTLSILGVTLLFDNRDNRLRPSRGHSISGNLDFAGLGGDVKYVKARLNSSKHWRLSDGGFIFSIFGEGGYIQPLSNRTSSPSDDDVRLVDRFFLGEPQMRGFDIRGIGPRARRAPYIQGPNNTIILSTDKQQITDDALGGRAYYLGRAELEIPLGSGAKELGLRPSAFIDVGSVFGVKNLTTANGGLIDRLPTVTCSPTQTVVVNGANVVQNTPLTTDDITSNGFACVSGSATPGLVGATFGFKDTFTGDTWKPRVSVGIGVNWNSPFGPFRIDIAKALIKRNGDDTKLITFNVGTQF